MIYLLIYILIMPVSYTIIGSFKHELQEMVAQLQDESFFRMVHFICTILWPLPLMGFIYGRLTR